MDAEEINSPVDTCQVQVLAVDDNQLNLDLLEEFLFDYEIKLDKALSGQQALELATNHDYSIIFMDINMPIMDGLSATRAIRNIGGSRADTPIVGISANDTSYEHSACLEAGMQDLLPKPIDQDLLINTVSKWSRTPTPPTSHQPTIENDGKTRDDKNTSKIIDIEEALDRFKGNTEMYKHFFKLFFEENKHCAADLKSHLYKKDLTSVENLGHKLKGLASNLSLTRVANLASDIEKQAKFQSMLPSNQQIENLENEMCDAVDVFNKLNINANVSSPTTFDINSFIEILKDLRINCERDLMATKNNLAIINRLNIPPDYKGRLEVINNCFMGFEMKKLKKEAGNLIELVRRAR